MNTLVANKIRSLRTAKNLSQEQAAEHLHISQSTYARMESGESNSWSSYIAPMCELFEIQPEELLRQDNIHVKNIKNNNGALYNVGTINQLSERLIEQYELRLKEKDDYIKRLESLLDK